MKEYDYKAIPYKERLTTLCGIALNQYNVIHIDIQQFVSKYPVIKDMVARLTKELLFDGSAKLDVVSELIGVNMESEEFDSVGGLIIGELGRFPEQYEEIVLNNIKFKVEEIDKNRVKKVRIFT